MKKGWQAVKSDSGILALSVAEFVGLDELHGLGPENSPEDASGVFDVAAIRPEFRLLPEFACPFEGRESLVMAFLAHSIPTISGEGHGGAIGMKADEIPMISGSQGLHDVSLYMMIGPLFAGFQITGNRVDPNRSECVTNHAGAFATNEGGFLHFGERPICMGSLK